MWLVSLQQQVQVSPGHRAREHAALGLPAPRRVPPAHQDYGEDGMEPDHVCHRLEHLTTDRRRATGQHLLLK